MAGSRRRDRRRGCRCRCRTGRERRKRWTEDDQRALGIECREAAIHDQLREHQHQAANHHGDAAVKDGHVANPDGHYLFATDDDGAGQPRGALGSEARLTPVRPAPPAHASLRISNARTMSVTPLNNAQMPAKISSV
jgi:hypothetical protein